MPVTFGNTPPPSSHQETVQQYAADITAVLEENPPPSILTSKVPYKTPDPQTTGTYLVVAYTTTSEKDYKHKYKMFMAESKQDYDTALSFAKSLRDHLATRVALAEITGYRVTTVALWPLEPHLAIKNIKEGMFYQFQVKPKVFINGPKKDLIFLKKQSVFVTEKGT